MRRVDPPCLYKLNPLGWLQIPFDLGTHMTGRGSDLLHRLHGLRGETDYLCPGRVVSFLIHLTIRFKDTRGELAVLTHQDKPQL